MNQTWENYCIILRSLVKRCNPQIANRYPDKWQINFESYVKRIYIEKCLICNQEWLAESKSTEQIRQHGIMHLKERNLLPFI